MVHAEDDERGMARFSLARGPLKGPPRMLRAVRTSGSFGHHDPGPPTYSPTPSIPPRVGPQMHPPDGMKYRSDMSSRPRSRDRETAPGCVRRPPVCGTWQVSDRDAEGELGPALDRQMRERIGQAIIPSGQCARQLRALEWNDE